MWCSSKCVWLTTKMSRIQIPASQNANIHTHCNKMLTHVSCSDHSRHVRLYSHTSQVCESPSNIYTDIRRIFTYIGTTRKTCVMWLNADKKSIIADGVSRLLLVCDGSVNYPWAQPCLVDEFDHISIRPNPTSCSVEHAL